jgi:8-oxo-dGTP diphosphatase
MVVVSSRLVLVVACALVDAAARVLVAQRPAGKAMAGLWEFPGGKVEAGESPETTLMRELREELGIEVEAKDLAPLTFASHAYPDFHLLMPLYLCRAWHGEVRSLEHEAIRFVPGDELETLAMPEADLPLIRPLRAALTAAGELR